jgi:DNA gyrase subunit A
MRLQRLTSLERTKILDDHKNTSDEIDRLRRVLADESLLIDIVKKELVEMRDRYGDKRLTEIADYVPEITLEDMIKEEEVVVTITNKGYIKRTSLDQYRNQMRGRQGKNGHRGAGGGFRRPPLHRLHSLQHTLLYKYR